MLKDNDYFVHKTCSVDKPISFVLFVTVLIFIYALYVYGTYHVLYSSQVNVMIFKLIVTRSFLCENIVGSSLTVSNI